MNLFKSMLTLCVFALLISCGNNDQSGAESPTNNAKTTSSTSAKIGGIDVPSFDNKELSNYAKQYAKYIVSYEKAYKKMQKGDMKAYNSLSKEGQELATMAQKFSTNMSEKDATKFASFMEKITKRLTDIASGK